MGILCKAIYRFKAIPVKLPVIIFPGLETIILKLKIIGFNCQRDLKDREQSRSITLPDSTQDYRVTVFRTRGSWHRNRPKRQWESTEPQAQTCTPTINLQQRKEEFTMRNRQPPHQVARGKLESLIGYITPWNSREKKTRQNSQKLYCSFLRSVSQANINEPKIYKWDLIKLMMFWHSKGNLEKKKNEETVFWMGEN